MSLLKQQSAETPEELQLIHPADRLMIRLIKIPHLADRLKGMLYMINFEETCTLLENVGAGNNECTCADLWMSNRLWTSYKPLAMTFGTPTSSRICSTSS